MDRLTIAAGRGPFDVVLRRWSDNKWATWATGLIDRETAALLALAEHDLPVPRLLAADRTGEQAGVPCLLMTALPGEPLFEPSDLPGVVRQMANLLVRIHDIVPTGLESTDPHGFCKEVDRGWIGDPALAHAVTEAAAAAPPGGQQVLVHGDYLPLNVLWVDERLSGVVDWTYAGSGKREVDVGRCRLGLAVLFSPEVAEAFLRRYEAEAGLHIDPRADIRALLAFGPSWLQFIPRQVAGRARADGRGIVERVESVLRTAAARLG
ncbi:phosphotransferase [Actinopolymorpha sp. B9G3]|uniref:phosphotransferase family protein n=1 Tax=Actinopolymorpha sp. B9G3 TaxID=3158970 RepID=UPI0032D974FB